MVDSVQTNVNRLVNTGKVLKGLLVAPEPPTLCVAPFAHFDDVSIYMC